MSKRRNRLAGGDFTYVETIQSAGFRLRPGVDGTHWVAENGSRKLYGPLREITHRLHLS